MPNQAQCCSIHETDTSPPEVPPRTLFLSPGLIGLGTPYAESITSYVTRVAALNGLTPLQIICGANVAPLTKQPPANLAQLQTAGKLCFHRRATSTSDKGRDFVAVLAAMLGRPQLHRLHWGTSFPGFSFARLGRSGDAWCSECLRSDAVPHGRMMWEVPAVLCCPVHGGLLQTVCHVCGTPVRFAGGDIVHCRRCGADRRNSPRSPEADAGQIAVANEIGRIIAMATDANAGFQCAAGRCVETILSEANSAGQGGFKARAAFTGTSAITIWKWQRHKSVPSLSRMIEIAMSCGYSLPEFFGGRAVQVPTKLQSAASSGWVCMRLTPLQRTELIAKIDQISREFPSWGPVKAAAKLGIDQVTLLQIAPSQYALMTKRRKATLARLRRARFAWFKRRVETHLRNNLATGTRSTWVGVMRQFRKPGILRHPAYGNFVRSALLTANARLVHGISTDKPVL